MADVIRFPDRCNLRDHLAEFIRDAEARNVRSLALAWVDTNGDTGTAHIVESRDFVRICRAMEGIAEAAMPEDDDEA